MKILVNTPRVTLMGGVAQIFRVLELNNDSDIDYFEIITDTDKRFISKLLRLVCKYIEFIFKVGKYDVIHINPSFDRNSFFRDAVYCIIARLFCKRVIVFWHGWEDEFEAQVRASKLLHLIFVMSFASADRTLVLGKIFKQKLINLGAVGSFDLITSIADDSEIERFSLEHKFEALKSKQKIDFLFLSRIVKEKGVLIAVEAINLVNARHPESCNLHIAGVGEYLDEIKAYVHNNEIKNIVFHGHVSGQSKFDLLEKTDVCLFPSYYGEGLPNSILESMLYAQPVISRINAGIPDHVKDMENGFLTEAVDGSIFVGFVEYFIKNKEEIERMGRLNHSIASDRYTVGMVRKKLISLYQQVYLS